MTEHQETNHNEHSRTHDPDIEQAEQLKDPELSDLVNLFKIIAPILITLWASPLEATEFVKISAVILPYFLILYKTINSHDKIWLKALMTAEALPLIYLYSQLHDGESALITEAINGTIEFSNSAIDFIKKILLIGVTVGIIAPFVVTKLFSMIDDLIDGMSPRQRRELAVALPLAIGFTLKNSVKAVFKGSKTLGKRLMYGSNGTPAQVNSEDDTLVN